MNITVGIKKKRTAEQNRIYNKNSHDSDPLRRVRNHEKYHKEHKEYCNEKSREWRKNNKERQREANRKYREKNRDKMREKDFKYSLTKFGLTLEDYTGMYSEQEGKCKICGIDENNLLPKSKLGIDHCHTTGKVRGLLCTNCNTGLGQFKDNIELLDLAINYLKSSYL